MKKVEKQKNKPERNCKLKPWQSVMSILLLAIVDAVYLVILMGIQSYSKLSQDLFVMINLCALVVLLLLHIAVLFQFRGTRRNHFFAISALIVVLLAAGITGAWLIVRVNETVGHIIVDGTVTESVELAVVVHGESEESETLNELNDKRVGIIHETLNPDIFAVSKAEFEEQSVTAEFVEYEGYQDIILALLKDEIDAGILPANYASMFSSEDGTDYLESLSSLFVYSREVEVDNGSVGNVDVENEPFNVLIIGMDESHSDVLMLATFNPVAFEVTYTSIARDSLVPICGNAKQKIAHSRNYGRACTIQTVEDMMDVEIDYFFEANFFGVVDMVDAIGGIEIWSPKEFLAQTASYDRGTIGIKIFEGFNYVDGQGALAFARERKAFQEGDFQRQLNQQQVITSFLTKLTEIRDVNVALNVLEAAGENVKTNIPLDMMVDLFNLVIKKISNSYEQGFSALKIKSSRVTGYNSKQYDGTLELMLYTYTPYQGSIKENREFLLSNLEPENQEIQTFDEFKWSANWTYDTPVYYHEWFDEQRVSEPVPDLVGDWYGENISALKSWAAQRNIKLNINYIEEGMEGFNPTLSNGTILYQDKPALRMTSKVTEMTVNVILVVPKVPDFTKMSLKEIREVNWLNDYGFEVTYKYIKSHNEKGEANPDYVMNSVGQVSAQSVAAETKSDGTFSKVEISVYDYPYIITALPKDSDGHEAIKTWATEHLVDSDEAVVYVEEKITHDQTLDGKVASVSPVLKGEPFVKTNGALSIQLYKYEEEPSIDIPSFVGVSIDELIRWAHEYGVTLNATEDTSTECGENNPVVVLTFSGFDGVTSIKPSELAGKSANYSYCKVTVVPTPEPSVAPDAGTEEPEAPASGEQTE
ncbi:MAG: LCP family protein [Erysipelotrichaceae bacterium]|nr:LCP family protein [Erysipelotrichaceae bacterium]